jgi:hypothetical protein
MRNKILLLLSILFLVSCYYPYSYKLIEPADANISLNKLSAEGEELINFFDEKYIYILGVIDKNDKIILFNKRKPAIITSEGTIIAYSLDNNELKISLKNVKYFYLKRSMPDTEVEAMNP